MLSYKKRFHDAVGLHSNRSEETSKCGKNITISCASCATFLFLPQFGVICDLLLNRPTAFVNLFVKRRPNLMRMFDFLSAYSTFFFFNPQLSRMMGLDAIARKRNRHIQVCSKRRHGKCQTRT